MKDESDEENTGYDPIHPSSFCLHPSAYPIFATSPCGRGITCTLTTSPTRPAASAPASTAARTAATSPLSVIATRPLPTLCCSTNVTLAALSAASHASTAATIPLVSINPIASPFAITISCITGVSPVLMTLKHQLSSLAKLLQSVAPQSIPHSSARSKSAPPTPP